MWEWQCGKCNTARCASIIEYPPIFIKEEMMEMVGKKRENELLDVVIGGVHGFYEKTMRHPVGVLLSEKDFEELYRLVTSSGPFKSVPIQAKHTPVSIGKDFITREEQWLEVTTSVGHVRVAPSAFVVGGALVLDDYTWNSEAGAYLRAMYRR